MPRAYRALLDRRRTSERLLQDAANTRAGVIASAVLNSVGGKKSGGSFSARDFFQFGLQASSRSTPSNVPKSPQEQIAVEAGWRAWASAATAVAAQRKALAS